MSSNPDRAKTLQRAWRARNPERVKGYGRAWRARNPERAKARVKAWKATNPDRARRHNLKSGRRFSSPPTRPEPALCEICGGVSHDNQALALDHCHLTGQFRGWLCDRCNRGLGYFRDSPLALRAAAEYIERAGVVPAKETA